MACAPACPGYQASRMASAFCWAQLTARARAVHQHDDERFAGGFGGFEKLLLRGGEGDVGAVAAGEAGDLDGHLFAFEVGREADEGEGDVGFVDGFEGLGAEWFDGRHPLEREACSEEAFGVGVGDLDGMRLGVADVEFDGGGGGAVLRFVDGDFGGGELFAVVFDGVALGLAAGVAVREDAAELIVARGRRLDECRSSERRRRDS